MPEIQQASNRFSHRNGNHHQPESVPKTDPTRQNRNGVQHFCNCKCQAPTKIPANRPVRASTVRTSHSKSRSRFQPFLQPFPAKITAPGNTLARQPTSVPKTTISSYRKIFSPCGSFLQSVAQVLLKAKHRKNTCRNEDACAQSDNHRQKLR